MAIIMKNIMKVLSLVLAIAVMLSCVSTTALASTGNSKISTTLAKMLDNLSDEEKLDTCIWLVFKFDRELVERETFKECGISYPGTLEEVDLYSKTYNRILGEMESAGNTSLIEKTGVESEDVVFCGTISPLVVLSLTKEQINTISDYEEVEFLDYDPTFYSEGLSESDLPVEDPYEDPLLPILPKIVREYYNDNSIEEKDIKEDFCIDIGLFIYVYKFSVDGYNYSDTVKETQIGEYVLKTAEPQPLIIYLETEKLYTIKEAYEKGIINDMYLEDISRFEAVGLTKKSNSDSESSTTEPTISEPTAEVIEPTTAEPATEITETTAAELTTEAKESTTAEATTEKAELTTVNTAAQSSKAAAPAKENKKKTVKPAVKANPIKVKAKAKTVKAKKLAKKARKIKAITVKNAVGKVTYKLARVTKKIKKLVKINKKGVITFAKGKYAKKTYKIRVKISAAGNKEYNSAGKTVTVKVKIK